MKEGCMKNRVKNMLVNESFSWYMKLSMCVSMVSSNHCHVICWLLYSTDTVLEWNSYCLWVAVNTCRINHEFLLGSICEQGQFCNCIFYRLAWVIQKRLPWEWNHMTVRQHACVPTSHSRKCKYQPYLDAQHCKSSLELFLSQQQNGSM